MKNFIVLAVLLPALILALDKGSPLVARAEEDDADDEIVDVEGESDESSVTEEGGEEEEAQPRASPDADTTILFTRPVISGTSGNLELPAGNLVEFLVGFTNKGSQDFMLETLEASFRYPVDFSFYIQNFSTIAYNRAVKPNHEATLAYSFIPAEAFAGRPFGLNINLNYRDLAGNVFQEAVYNETVQIVELEEGLDGETFFLYVFMAACVVLMLVVGQQFLYSLGRKRVGKKPVVETGTSNPNDVDYDWLPKETLNHINKKERSPRAPKQSPRQRKAKRSAGSDD
ncbi:Translocon-associated protein subunit alpha [Cryptotermes secundus]|uniref:Translocon-associated protein subunit alpha n=1 Tax=Cryptotermes secundus TaxID=105785 RepID=A0A2J7PCZ7_9NEOP|nr:translocon-associated protein subunit alpha [Cryptotermes secundus]PNF14198.1 Translocon-associated protein subunit alpha [Cryptotermes secundus]